MYIIIYIFLLKFVNSKSKYILSLLIIIFSILIGFRSPEIGIDTKTYISIFKEINNENLNFSGIESGYIGFNRILSFFTSNEIILFLLVGFISIIFLIKGIKRLWSLPILVIYIYYCLYFFDFNFNIIRQGMVFSLFIYSLKWILLKKKWKYYFTILIGSFFHSIFILAMPIYSIFYRIKLKNKNIIKIFLLAIILKTILPHFIISISKNIPYISKKFQDYGIYSGNVINGISLLGLSFRIIIVLFIIFYIKNNKNISKELNLIFKIYIYGIFLYILLIGFGKITTRVTLFFKAIDIFIFALIYKENKLYKLIIIIICTYYFFVGINLEFNHKKVNYPYKINQNIGEI